MTDFRPSEWDRLTEKQRAIVEKYQIPKTPKVPLGKIAKELGLIVKLATLPMKISGEIRPNEDAPSGFIIRINRHEVRARQRFTLAHEIAHYLIHKDKIKNGIIDNVLYRSNLSNAQEAEANRFAADLIMPWHILKEHIPSRKSINDEATIEEIANKMEVSRVALKIRLGIED